MGEGHWVVSYERERDHRIRDLQSRIDGLIRRFATRGGALRAATRYRRQMGRATQSGPIAKMFVTHFAANGFPDAIWVWTADKGWHDSGY